MTDKCTCKPCGFCGGKGYLWLDLGGNLTNYHPMDDMAEMEECDMCNGEGTMDCCDYCRDQYELEEMEREEQERMACECCGM